MRIAIIGAGRMGQGLGLALQRRGQEVTLLSRRPHAVVEPFSLVVDDWTAALEATAAVLVAVPDNAVGEVARELAALGAIASTHVVLHVSGPLDRSALATLDPTGAGLGSFHPLQTVADPLRAPDRLAGAYAGLEGDARAVELGETLARILGMVPFRIPTGAKARYHAAAVMAANYPVALMGVAERLAREAGIGQDVAAHMFLPLLQGAAANVEAMGPVQALTGPVRRGDLATIRLHLAALNSVDRLLYVDLGLAALALAREGGMADELALQVERTLKTPG